MQWYTPRIWSVHAKIAVGMAVVLLAGDWVPPTSPNRVRWRARWAGLLAVVAGDVHREQVGATSVRAAMLPPGRS